MPLRTLVFGSAGKLRDFSAAAKKVTAAAVVLGGTGYNLGDVLTVIGGEGEVAAVLEVTAETGNVIDTVDVVNEGAYTISPSNPVSVTGGDGEGATFNLTVADAITAVTVENIIVKHSQWYLNYWVN